MKSWLPWQFLLRVAARRRGFIDPIEFLARLRRFAQPAEVHEPIELVRAGVLFHARGLINTKVFQYNLDWVWPYWVARQFDPGDSSFLPRAFSFSHVNLTHRNWTALGLPGMDDYPIVDPRGLVTLPYDPWSLDWWLVPEEGGAIYPSRLAEAEQRLEFLNGLAVVTRCTTGGASLESRAWVEAAGDNELREQVVLEARARLPSGGLLVLAARPVNPEGVHFIEHVTFNDDGWVVNGRHRVRLGQPAAGVIASTYARGDLSSHLGVHVQAGADVRCSAGLATAAATFRASAGETLAVRARVELVPTAAKSMIVHPRPRRVTSWEAALEGAPEVRIPDERWRFLHAAALRTIILLSPGDIFPGPSTYRRFWFRDACLVMNALLAANRDERVRAALERFPARQRADGYFHSQEGEWDANGQVLWIADRYERTTGRLVPDSLLRSLSRGASWITRKRRRARPGTHAGLLPPGFSAEHLGPVDQYYWDDFWGIAGLRAAAELVARHGDSAAAAHWRDEGTAFARDVRRSLERLPAAVIRRGVPASPHRRMDAGAIGSMVADYPLQLDDVVSRAEMLRTAEWLWRNCRHDGGFFQDMIHSGINAYLTLALAQTFMRHGDGRHRALMQTVASLASPTGQWPEAVHPRTGGGCMGDGQHTWAAAEWILAVRALFLREERHGLVVGAGLPAEWFEEGERLAYGPTNTAWGRVAVAFEPRDGAWFLEVQGEWHGTAPRVWIAAPGFAAGWAELAGGEVRLQPDAHRV